VIPLEDTVRRHFSPTGNVSLIIHLRSLQPLLDGTILEVI
jgi:hypothetical protein